MKTPEAIEIYGKMLTRVRQLELERLKREQLILQALIRMHKYRILHDYKPENERRTYVAHQVS